MVDLPHPPGYPIFDLLGKALTFIPVGGIAFRVVLLSALSCAASAALSYLIMKKAAKSTDSSIVAFAVAGCTAFSGLAWEQAVVAEVYGIHTALSLLMVLMLTYYQSERDVRFLYLTGFVLGLGITAHYTALLLVPGLLLAVTVMSDEKVGLKHWLISCFFVMLGLSVFIYLVPRSYSSPGINWGSPDNFVRLWQNVTRASYGDMAAFTPVAVLDTVYGAVRNIKFWLALAVVVALIVVVRQKKAATDRGGRLLPVVVLVGGAVFLVSYAVFKTSRTGWSYFIELVWSEARLTIPLTIAGAVLMYYRNRHLFLGFIMMISSIVIITVFRFPVPSDDYIVPLAAKFFSFGFFLAGILAGYAGIEIERKLSGFGGGMAARAALAIVFMLLPAGNIYANYRANDRSGQFMAQDYSVAILNTMDQDSVFLTQGDHQLFLSVYQRVVECRRQDIEIFDASGNIFRQYDQMANINNMGGRQIYCTQEKELNTYEGIDVEQYGLLNRFPSPFASARDPWKYYNIRVGPLELVPSDFSDRQFVANYFIYLGRHKKDVGDNPGAIKDFDSSLLAGYDVMRAHFDVAIMFDQMGLKKRAIEEYEKVLRLAPEQGYAYQNMGMIYLALGDYKNAAKSFRKVAKIYPALNEPYMGLAIASERTGDIRLAVYCWKKYRWKSTGADVEYADREIARLSAPSR